MKKRLIILGLLICICVAGCKGKEEESNGNIKVEFETENETESKPEDKEENENSDKTENVNEEECFGFKELADLEFYFSSGAGGWRTLLWIAEDGSFHGQHSDSDMGSTGEGYPNGTYYISNFYGKFDTPVQKNDYTYSLKIKELAYEEECGTEEIKDDILYVYCEAYGIGGAKELLLYIPGAPMQELPEGYKNWVRYSMENPDAEELPFYGLYHETEENGFSSYKFSHPLENLMEYTKNRSYELRESLEKEDLNQTELNEKSKELYDIWDDALNEIWSELKTTLSEEDFQELLAEQRTWISEKEKTVKDAGKEVEGGSIYPLVVNMTAAAVTEERVYELYDLWSGK